MVAKYKNPPIWAKFGFQVDYDVQIDIHRWFAMVLGIGWNFPEILSDMCTHNFDAYKFQNGRRCHKKNEKNLKCSELDET